MLHWKWQHILIWKDARIYIGNIQQILNLSIKWLVAYMIFVSVLYQHTYLVKTFIIAVHMMCSWIKSYFSPLVMFTVLQILWMLFSRDEASRQVKFNFPMFYYPNVLSSTIGSYFQLMEDNQKHCQYPEVFWSIWYFTGQ